MKGLSNIYNDGDLRGIPDDIKKDLKIIPASEMDEIVELILG
jgi:ATP-dependent Lon protease